MDQLVEGAGPSLAETEQPRPPHRPEKARTADVLSNPSFFSWNSVLPQMQAEKQAGKTLVVSNGHFVLMQPGHSVSLEQAREVGTKTRADANADAVTVIVVINANHQTEQKDPVKAAAQTAFERASMVYDNRHSDLVVISEAPTGDRTLVTDFQRMAQAGLIDQNFIYVKGGDYGTQENVPPEAQIVLQNGGQFKVVERVGDYSTTNQVQKMMEAMKRQGGA